MKRVAAQEALMAGHKIRHRNWTPGYYIERNPETGRLNNYPTDTPFCSTDTYDDGWEKYSPYEIIPLSEVWKRLDSGMRVTVWDGEKDKELTLNDKGIVIYVDGFRFHVTNGREYRCHE